MNTTDSPNWNEDYTIRLSFTIVFSIIFSAIILLLIIVSFATCCPRLMRNNRDPNSLNCFQKLLKKIFSPRLNIYEINYNWVEQTNNQAFEIPVSNVLVQHSEIPNEDPELECPICLEKIGPIKCNIGCDHAFHEECIKTWIINNNKTTCPICRNSVPVLVV